MKFYIIAVVFFVFVVSAFANTDEANKWRGPLANGIYDEPNLLEKWPDNGPEILWVVEQLGNGFSSPVFANGKIYVTGEKDHVGYVFLLNEDGSLIKRYSYGKEFTQSYPGSRSTPTVVGNLLYMHSGEGMVYCMDESTGEVKWKKNLFSDFDGANLRFGLTESLVVDGEKVYVTPGGKKHSLVALNRYTGELIWSVTADAGLSAYCTPLLFEYQGDKMLVTMMGDKIIGVDREKGLLKWSFNYRNQRGIHPNTPIYHNGELYCFSGYGHGGVKLKISPQNNKVEQMFWSEVMESKMGGAVLLDGKLYGSGDNNRGWYTIDWTTGDQLFESNKLANGVVIAANGLLYKYSDRGELALVKPTDNSFDVISETKITHGTAQHWAHPVIRNGVLYVRHGEALIAYHISK